ncbi:MAG: hypothetical protein WB557_10105 [Solirubrobacteraceae bacterium]
MSPATRAPEPAAVVLVDPINDDARALWHAVLDLAEQLPEDGWCLVGGLMVQLHAYRYEQRGVRPTQDVDVLADSRMRPRSLTEVIAERLLDLGYEVAQPASAIDPPTICRFEREGATIDVLGPDGMKGTPPKTVGGFQTIQVPGGTQALARTESVEIRVGDGPPGSSAARTSLQPFCSRPGCSASPRACATRTAVTSCCYSRAPRTPFLSAST